jgi:MGT family glycosyltransferase
MATRLFLNEAIVVLPRLLERALTRLTLGPIPRNVEVHPSIPQLAVLASASAFITHAGMASCSEALWFGVPTIAIPQAVDQFRNAAMLEALGVGRQLSAADQLSPAALRGAVESVAGAPGLAGRLAEVRHRSSAESGDFSEARSNSRYSSTISMIVD